MENVPKIALKRLQSPAAESHPDADLLTAFAEHSLAGRERDQVVEHIARCGDCREAVSLALPAQVELPALTERSTNWFLSPGRRLSGLRWAAVAAAVVLIASVGTVRYLRQQSSELASNVMPSKPEIAASAQGLPPSSQVAAPQTEERKDKLPAPRSRTASVESKPALSVGKVIHGSGTFAGTVHGGQAAVTTREPSGLNVSPRRDLASAPALQNPASSTMVPSASTTVEVQSQDAQLTIQPSPERPQGQLLQNEPADQSLVSADQSVGKAKPASAQASPPLAPAPLLGSDPGLMKSQKVLRWTISATGALQRSLDGGKTWLDVNVAATSSQPMSANLVRSRSSTTTPAITIFRALSVSASDAEVWAGGTGGALYHTTDGGNRWARVVPSADGIVLTGDVITIHFPDPGNGAVTTSTREVWTTADGGQTWQKQQ
jgi:hypothetical protein